MGLRGHKPHLVFDSQRAVKAVELLRLEPSSADRMLSTMAERAIGRGVECARELFAASTQIALLAILIAGAAALQSCATGGSANVSPPLDISGGWSGATFPGCRSNGGVNCYKRPIAFNLNQNGSRVTGSYACPVGNMMCGMDNTGSVVDGKMDGSHLSDLRVVFSDATNCLYQGEFTGGIGNGEYMCFAGAGRIVEQGGWHLERLQPPSQ
jgi:hypothetical protein